MILWNRRSVAATALVSVLDAKIPCDNVGDKDNEASKTALILGGFLLPASAYEPFGTVLTDSLGYSTSTLAYDDPLLTKSQASTIASHIVPPEILSMSPDLMVGHSKGARSIAEWMPYWMEESIGLSQMKLKFSSREKPPSVILIEPVDVVPPGAEPYSLLEEDWKSHLATISRIPTLIIAAPYTDTSRRYGKVKNLCAPTGKDALAFYRVASDARKQHPDSAAPLKYVEFEGLGHNDVIITSKEASAIGGCANGPDRNRGAQLVTQAIRDWVELLNSSTDGNQPTVRDPTTR